MPSLPLFLQFIGGRGETREPVRFFLAGEKEVGGRFRARTLCAETVAIGLLCIRFGRFSLWQLPADSGCFELQGLANPVIFSPLVFVF
jgi:hypothetical protein